MELLRVGKGVEVFAFALRRASCELLRRKNSFSNSLETGIGGISNYISMASGANRKPAIHFIKKNPDYGQGFLYSNYRYPRKDTYWRPLLYRQSYFSIRSRWVGSHIL
jgi:hypothetical protein